jgi:hypothetical protein
MVEVMLERQQVMNCRNGFDAEDKGFQSQLLMVQMLK